MWIFECHVKQDDGASNSLDGHVMSHYVPVSVLQPGWYRLVRDGHAAAQNIAKHLQIHIITGRCSAGRNTQGATLDQLVLVRILQLSVCLPGRVEYVDPKGLG